MIFRFEFVYLILVLKFCIIFGTANITNSFYLNSEKQNHVKDFLKRVCEAPEFDATVIKSIKNNISTKNLKSLCKESGIGSPVLLWIPISNLTNFYDTGKIFLGKTSDQIYCNFNISSNKCISVSKDEINVNEIFVLHEKYPERYEVNDIKFSDWMNVTKLGTSVLGYTFLKNRDSVPKYIEQDISYIAIDEQLMKLPEYVEADVPVTVFEGDKKLYNFENTRSRSIKDFDMIHVIKHMAPKSAVNATLTGTMVKQYTDFEAKLLTIYHEDKSFDWSKSHHKVFGSMIESLATNAKISYSDIIEDVAESVFRDRQFESSSNGINVHIENNIDNSSSEDNQVYPEFKPFAMAAGILLLVIFLVAFLDILRRVFIRKSEKLNKKGFSKI